MSTFDVPAAVSFDWNVSEQEYRDYPALNFHTLAAFHRDPRAFSEGFFDQIEETEPMRFGTALHALVLQGEEAYANKIAVFSEPVNPKTGEAYGATTKTYSEARSAFEALNSGKLVISSSADETVRKLYAEFLFHPVAPAVLNGKWGESERPVKGTLELDGKEIAVKGLIDRYSSAGLVEVKTTAALDDASGRDKFRYAVYDYKYLLQLAFYHLLLTECLGAPYAPCWIVAFERNPPNRVAVYRISADVIDKARDVVKNWLREYVDAKETKYYPSRFEDVQNIDFYNPDKDC